MIESVCETDATSLLASVRAARRSGDVHETERLATECVRVAEACLDALSAFHGATAPGMLHLSRAEPEKASEWFALALEIARRGCLWKWIGVAHHNLFIANRDSGNCAAGGKHAAAALEFYEDNRQKHKIPLLQGDIENCRLDVLRTPEQAFAALACWRSVPSNTRTPRERLIVRVNAMEAASLICRRGWFFEAADGYQDALNEASVAGEGEDVARSLVLASVASCRMSDFDRAARVAADALRIALSRDEGRIAEAAGEARMAARAEKCPPPLWD